MRAQLAPARILLAACALLIASPALGQDLQVLKPAPGVGPFVQLESLDLMGHRLLAPSLWVHYGNQPIVRRDNQARISEIIIEHQTSIDAQLAVGLYEIFEFGLHVPMVIHEGEGIERRGLSGAAFGDIRGIARAQIIGDPGQSGLVLGTQISAPTGDPDRFFGSQGWTFTPTLTGGLRDFGVEAVGNIGVRLRTHTDRVLNVDLNHELVWGTGVSSELGTWFVSAFGEIYGSVALGDVLDDTVTRPVESLFGLRFDTRFGGLITVGAGLGVNPDRGVPRARALVGFTYRRPPARANEIDPTRLFGVPDEDSDDDGLDDRDDLCPDQPEDKDGFQDEDGCPDLDNDQDGIPDTLDRCPMRPETVNGIDDDDGCPEVADTDKDGVPDDRDQCPLGMEDMDGFRDDDGCADPDNDGDGVRDVDDICRDEPGDGPDGCPRARGKRDTDKDGILDAVDQCPAEPETFNGFEDTDGCPDVLPTRVKLTQTKIEILEKVFFETNKAVIKPVSYAVLNEVADVVKAVKRIKHLEVQGHTDNQGAAKYNADLSQRRAEAVRVYLMSRGVEPARLSAKGFGEQKPIQGNDTPAGRATNRRVDFLIRE